MAHLQPRMHIRYSCSTSWAHCNLSFPLLEIGDGISGPPSTWMDVMVTETRTLDLFIGFSSRIHDHCKQVKEQKAFSFLISLLVTATCTDYFIGGPPLGPGPTLIISQWYDGVVGPWPPCWLIMDQILMETTWEFSRLAVYIITCQHKSWSRVNYVKIHPSASRHCCMWYWNMIETTRDFIYMVQSDALHRWFDGPKVESRVRYHVKKKKKKVYLTSNIKP